ncbi:MAG: alkaline phosphatase family protein [Vicinamibacterales bacterium]
MLARHRRLAVALALLLSAAAAHAAPATPPRLVVLLVVDQMRADYIARYSHQWTGGLRRLVDGGAWFSRAAYPYLTTVTCVGHATISTGAFPRTHGIVGNSWFDRDLGRSVGCTWDPSLRTISYAASVEGGQGPSHLRSATLADELRAQSPVPGRVVTMSIKERAAIGLAGQRGDAVTWYNGAAGGFVTSSAYTSVPVPYVAAFAKANPVSADLGKVWTRSLPADQYLFADAGTGEKPAAYWTAEFPHPLKVRGDAPDAQFFEAWESSPFSDDYLGRLAIASVDALKLGQGGGTDFLGVSFSALDLIGHDFGPASHEVQDTLVRLDRTIGALVDHLDRTVGADNYVVALTGDHGAAPIPEQVAALGFDAGRLDAGLVRAAAQRALQAALGEAPHAVRGQYSDLILPADALERLRRDPDAVDEVLRAIRAVPGVAAAFFAEQLEFQAAAGDRHARAALMSHYPGRSGDVLVVPQPYWFFVTADGTAQPGSATTHGTMYGYDQQVPIVFFGKGIKPGEYVRAVTPADIAPTLAHLCGVTLADADGEVLTEALAAAPAAAGRGR